MTRHSRPVLFVDLEGVLGPEMWPFLADRLGIAELRSTTREMPDYRSLMAQRLSALGRHGIRLERICREVAHLDPIEGAIEFVEGMGVLAEVVLVTDSFHPMNAPMIARFSFSRVLCHRFAVDAEDMITGYTCWNDLAGKDLCFQGATVDAVTLALGDALNDIAMLRRASMGLLFRPSAVTIGEAPDLGVAMDHRTALELFQAHLASIGPAPASTGGET